MVVRSRSPSPDGQKEAGYRPGSTEDNALKEIKKDPKLLRIGGKYATYRDDKRFVMNAINRNAMAYRYAKSDLKKDVDVALKAVEKDGMVYQYLAETVKGEPGIRTAALKQNGRSLQFMAEPDNANSEDPSARPPITDDQYYVKMALVSDPTSYTFIPDSSVLWKNKEFMKMVLYDSEITMKNGDKMNVVLKMLQKDPYLYKDIPEGNFLLKDEEFALAAVKLSPLIVERVHPTLKESRSYAKKLLEYDPSFVEFVDDSLKSDASFLIDVPGATMKRRILMYAKVFKTYRSPNGSQFSTGVPEFKDEEMPRVGLYYKLSKTTFERIASVSASIMGNEEHLLELLKKFNSKEAAKLLEDNPEEVFEHVKKRLPLSTRDNEKVIQTINEIKAKWRNASTR